MDFNKESVIDDKIWDSITESKDDLKSEIENCEKEAKKHIGFFKIQSANDWIEEAKHLKVDKMLCDCLWFEGELCVLFASANLGKSILGYQIANSITTGKAIEPFRLEAKKQPVLYFDFELNKKKFRKRYTTDNKKPFQFDASLKRIEIDVNEISESDINGYNEDLVLSKIEQVIVQTEIKICIVDNMSYLIRNNEKSKDATPFLFKLNHLKHKYGLSILVLGHTPKREYEKPLSLMDLAGSAAMGNFIDSAFAIGKVQDNVGERYIKQVKQRDSEEVYHAENVPIMKIEQVNSFLQMTFQKEYGIEKDLLSKVDSEKRQDLIQKVKDLITMGKTYDQIKEMTGLAKGTISKYKNM